MPSYPVPFRSLPRLALLLPALFACAELTPPEEPGRLADAANARPLPPPDWTAIPGSPGAGVLARTAGGTLFASDGASGVVSSTDDGASWLPLAGFPAGLGAASLVAGTGNEIVAGTGDGVYRSSDGGGQWSLIGFGGSYVPAVAVDAAGTLFAGTSGMGGGVHRYDASTGTWTTVLPAFNPRDFIVTFLKAGPGVLYLGTLMDNVWYSTDQGATWAVLSSVYSMRSFLPPVRDLIPTPGGAHLLSWSDGLLRTADLAGRWRRVYGSGGMNQLGVDAADRLYATHDDGTLYRAARDGSRWGAVSGPLAGAHIEDILVLPGGEVIAATYGGLYRVTPAD